MTTYDRFETSLNQVISPDSPLNEMPLEGLLDAIPRIDQVVDVQPGATVLIRADLDVPIENGKVVDPSRILSSIETVKYAMDNGFKTVLFGHLGRKGDASLEPVCEAFSHHLGVAIEFVRDWLEDDEDRMNDGVVDAIRKAPSGKLFMLENTRKYTVERILWKASPSEFPDLYHKLYSLSSDISRRVSDYEVNEAIAASNLDFSSSVMPLALKKTAMGFFIHSEFKNHITAARRVNFVAISGSKADKLNDLEAILDRGHLILIVVAGALAMALAKARAQIEGSDMSIGLAETDPSYKGYIEAARFDQAKRIIEKCRSSGVDLILPCDYVLDNGEISDMIPPGHAQLDIGPRTREIFAERVRSYVEKSKLSPADFSMYYNGVFGMFEDVRFEGGTRAFISLLKEMTNAGISTYVGGGEGRLALMKYGSLSDATHAFTCGGTVLKSLTDRHIAYLKAMYLNNSNR